MNDKTIKEVIESELKIYDRLFPFGFILLMSIFFVIVGWSKEISFFGVKLSLLNFAYIYCVAAPFYFAYIDRVFDSIFGVISLSKNKNDDLYYSITAKGLFNIYYSPTMRIPLNGTINKLLLFIVMFTSLSIMLSFIRETELNKYILGILGLYLGKSHISIIRNIIRIDKYLLSTKDKVIPTTGISFTIAIIASIVMCFYLN
ncbi:hypothetical protein [Aquimarina longa]|uniref:hypothetical protein n=1 Tax=Aquimarina longa TaxID=1080221 RepID=UPI000782B60B|nr:hypothetical protein [Aquimarina longa]